MALFIHSILDQNNNGQKKTGGHHQASDRPIKKTNRKKGKDHIEYRYSKKKRKEKNRLHPFSSSISLCEKYCEVKQHDDGHGKTKKKEKKTMMMIKITLYTLYINKYTIRLHNG